MSDLDDSFEKLLGRQPSDAERSNLYRVRDALGLKNNDALWLVLMALQTHQTQYEKIPQEIARAAKEAVAACKTTSDATVKASVESAKASMSNAVAEIAQKVAQRTAQTKKLQWVAISIATAAVALAGVFFYAHRQAYSDGYYVGFAAAYKQSRDEKAAVAWANTPEGKLAYKFAETGELQRVARCNGKGWIIKDGVCYPYSDNEKTYGWVMP